MPNDWYDSPFGWFDDTHEALHEEVRAALSRVRELRGSADDEDGRLIPIRPDIVNGVDADNFYQP